MKLSDGCKTYVIVVRLPQQIDCGKDVYSSSLRMPSYMDLKRSLVKQKPGVFRGYLGSTDVEDVAQSKGGWIVAKMFTEVALDRRRMGI